MTRRTTAAAIALAIALVISSALALAIWTARPSVEPAPSPTANATLVVNGSSTIAVLSPTFLGVNLRADYLLPGAQSDAAASAGVTLVRWPGGALADRYDLFGTGGGPLIYNSSGGSSPAPSTPADFAAWCRESGCHAIVTVPGEINSPRYAAQEIAYFEQTLHFTPAYWEIGNEPALWQHYGVPWANWSSPARSPPTPSEYAALVARYISAMRAVDPTARFLGLPGVGTGGSAESAWLAATVAVNGPNLSAVALHVYPAGSAINDSLAGFFQSLGGANNLPGRYSRATSLVARTCPTCAIAVLVDELGPSTGNVVPPTLQGFPMALYDGAEALQAIEANVSGIAFWVAQGEYPAAWVDPSGAAEPPVTLFSDLFAPLPRAVLSSQTLANGSGLFAVALRAAPGQLILLVANTNASSSFQLKALLPGEILGGQLSIWTGGALLPMPISAGAPPVWTLPPLSMTRIALEISPAPRDPAGDRADRAPSAAGAAPATGEHLPGGWARGAVAAPLVDRSRGPRIAREAESKGGGSGPAPPARQAASSRPDTSSFIVVQTYYYCKPWR